MGQPLADKSARSQFHIGKHTHGSETSHYLEENRTILPAQAGVIPLVAASEKGKAQTQL